MVVRAGVRVDRDWMQTTVPLFLDEIIEGGRVEIVLIEMEGSGSCDIGELVIDTEALDAVSC